jgi:orotate phosphoribosyltransferase
MNIKIADPSVAAATAKHLLSIGAVKLSPDKPFTWASGWKSPIYCDNRMTLSYPETRSFMKEQLVSLIKKEFPGVGGIAGVATAGIPQGALLADSLDLPFCYVRSKPKDHGMENLIEGRIETGQKVVVVEDLVSTGGSSLKAVEALRGAKAQVLGMAAIFTYGFPQAEQNFVRAEVNLACLCDYESLIKVASDNGYINASHVASLGAWRTDPANWKA